MLVEGGNLAGSIASQIMNSAPQTISSVTALGDAEEVMADARIQCLVVTDTDGMVAGVIQIF
jgi:predicted transcriptional regulator